VTIVAYERTSQEKEEGVRAAKARGDEALEQKTQDDAKNVEAFELRYRSNRTCYQIEIDLIGFDCCSLLRIIVEEHGG
jgi:hypothetical protein